MALQEFLRFFANGARAYLIPDQNQDHGNNEDHRGDGVDFGSDAATKPCPDFERERIVASDEEERDGDFVHGKREDEQAGGDERKLQIGESDAPESLKRSGAQVERSFFLDAIHFLESGEEFCGGDRNQRGAVSEKNGEEAEFKSGENSDH